MARDRDMPVGVKILAILAYIGAVFAVLGALALFAGGAFLGSFLSDLGPLSVLGGAALVGGGIFLLLLAVLDFFIGRGLWNGRNWARIVVLVFAVLGVLGGLGTLFAGDFTSIVGLIINGVVIWYLGFVDEVKQAFA